MVKKGFCVVVLFAAMLMSVSAADWDSAEAAYFSDDFETAIIEYKALAEQGNADAQSRLGFMYENGQGVPEDGQEAERWYRSAAVGRKALAEQGDAEAQVLLGEMYSYGLLGGVLFI